MLVSGMKSLHGRTFSNISSVDDEYNVPETPYECPSMLDRAKAVPEHILFSVGTVVQTFNEWL